MLSAVGQGALGIVCRSGDDSTRKAIAALDHAPTRIAVTAERGLLRSLGGSCQVPVAGKATVKAHELAIKGLISSLDGTRVLKEQLHGSTDRPAELGLQLGQKLLAMGAAEILADIAEYGANG
jgi:hydroxymethylbilane synthase